ncbi:MAG: M14 family metallopeptidase [Bacteroidales bacterium]
MKHITTLILLAAIYQLHAQEPLTPFEKSNYKACGTYEEVVNYCKALDNLHHEINYSSFGKSGRFHDLPLLVIDKDGFTSPQLIRNSGRVILLIQASIHPGEPDGTSAGLMYARDLLQKPELNFLLDNVSVLFIPVFNVDGYLRRSPYNRINQNGPEEMGWRTNATNLNLNRDYLRAESPEMKAWHALFNLWVPDFFIDCHTTDGADYQYAITYDLPVYGNMEQEQTEWMKEKYLHPLKDSMSEAGYPIFRYVSFRNWHDHESGLTAWVSGPMLAQGYCAIKNRPGFLIETHMLKPYEVRVWATYEALINSMKILNKESNTLKEVNYLADAYTISRNFRENTYPLEWEATDEYRYVEFHGKTYTKEKSDITDGTYYKYEDKDTVYSMKFYDDIQAQYFVRIPRAIIIPPEWSEVIQRLDIHKIEYQRILQQADFKVMQYTFDDVSFSNTPYEGAMRVNDFTLDSVFGTKTFPAQSVYIPLNQVNAKVIMHLLHPEASSSMLKWGYFNAIFEQKEYAEIYVMEQKAKQMLENDSVLKKNFEQWQKDNPKLMKEQWPVMNWFYKHTAYWDQQINVYPPGFIF